MESEGHSSINLSRNKYFLIYLISLLFFAVCCFNYENYIHPLKEIVIIHGEEPDLLKEG
jgi:hypothetical protein